jgi:hypothetical protein
LMIAIITENVQEKPPPQNFTHSKDDLSSYHADKFHFSPLDSAHYANFSSSLNQSDWGKQCEIQQ